jgi:transcriptional regulator with XRE-family HTH domain
MDGEARRRRSATHATGYRDLIHRLRRARLEAGLTQSQVAALIGRPQSFVAKCELGERRLDPLDLQRFARIYQKPLSYFLRRG